MVGDAKYLDWLNTQARRFGAKYSIDHQDLLQEFLLSVLEGKSSKFEYVFFEKLREYYCRGITGKRDAVDMVSGEELWSSLRESKRSMDEFEFIEYLADLRRMLNDTEYKLVCMLLTGFDKRDIFEESKTMTRRELVKFWERIGVKNMRLWST